MFDLKKMALHFRTLQHLRCTFCKCHFYLRKFNLRLMIRPKSHTVHCLGTMHLNLNLLRDCKKRAFYIVWIRIVWTKFRHTTTSAVWPTRISYIASLPFIYPLPWPHGIVKCPSTAYLRIQVEVISHPGTFLWIRTYYYFCVLLCFSHTIAKYLVLDAVKYCKNCNTVK